VVVNKSNAELEYDDFVIAIWPGLVESVLPQFGHDVGLAEEVARAAITQQQKKQRSRLSADTQAQIYEAAFRIAASDRKQKSLLKKSAQKQAKATDPKRVDFIGVAVGPDQEIDPRRNEIGIDHMRRDATRGRRRKDRLIFLGSLVLMPFVGLALMILVVLLAF